MKKLSFLILFFLLQFFVYSQNDSVYKNKFGFVIGGNYFSSYGNKYIRPITNINTVAYGSLDQSYAGFTKKNSFGSHMGIEYYFLNNKHFSFSPGLFFILRTKKLESDSLTVVQIQQTLLNKNSSTIKYYFNSFCFDLNLKASYTYKRFILFVGLSFPLFAYSHNHTWNYYGNEYLSANSSLIFSQYFDFEVYPAISFNYLIKTKKNNTSVFLSYGSNGLTDFNDYIIGIGLKHHFNKILK
jgi:hypothetical protein